MNDLGFLQEGSNRRGGEKKQGRNRSLRGSWMKKERGIEDDLPL